MPRESSKPGIGLSTPCGQLNPVEQPLGLEDISRAWEPVQACAEKKKKKDRILDSTWRWSSPRFNEVVFQHVFGTWLPLLRDDVLASRPDMDILSITH
jgi:hypothetical protein